MKRREYFYIGALVIVIVGWITDGGQRREENRELKTENARADKRISRLNCSYDSVMQLVSMRDKQDSILAINDSLQAEKIKANILTTTNAKASTIIHMPADSFLLLLSGFINDRNPRN